jgi:molybdenum cofactor cytidylyltransferase
MSQTRGFELAAVILGAGSSSRMGRPKLLLPWQGTSMIGHVIRQWERLGARQIGVVCAARDELMQAELKRLEFPRSNCIGNPAPERGMFGSVQCAAGWPGWKPSLSHWVIVLGDQPHLGLPTLERLIEFGRTHPDKVCQPARVGRARHPVLIPKPLFNGLVGAPAASLKEYLSQQEVATCDIDDPALDLDIDTPEDYRRALEMSLLRHTK